MTALFAASVNGEASREAFGKITAEKISVPEIRFTFTGASLVLHDFTVSHMQNGMASSVAFSSGELEVRAGAQNSKFTIGTLTLTEADAGFVLASLKNGLIKSDYLRYASLKWDGMSGVLGGNQSSSIAASIDIGAVTAENTYDKGMPTNFSFDIDSARIAPNGAMASAALYGMFGMNKLYFNMHFKGSYDWTARRMIIDNGQVGFARLASLSIKGVFGNTTKALLSSDQDIRSNAVQSLTLESAALRIVNEGALDKAVAMLAAKIDRKGGDTIPDNLYKVLTGSNAKSEDGAAVAAFVSNPRSLTISIKPRSGSSPMPLRGLSGQKDLSWFDSQIRAND